MPEDVFGHITPEDVFGHITPEDVFGHIMPEDVFGHIMPEDNIFICDGDGDGDGHGHGHGENKKALLWEWELPSISSQDDYLERKSPSIFKIISQGGDGEGMGGVHSPPNV